MNKKQILSYEKLYEAYLIASQERYKYKEVLDKIKDKIKIKIAREFNEDDYMINADDLIEIKELLEEIK